MKRTGWLAIIGLLILGGLLSGGRTICPLPLRPRAVGPPVPAVPPAGNPARAGSSANSPK